MDLESRTRWFDYAKAKDMMFHFTDTAESPWWWWTPTTSDARG